ncbi:acyltransferase [Latilactobacillus sakei]|uniref:Acyltransferase n=1 Tax=Latilactobacillus sakei TaxID=1599 RepID=A0AAF0K3C7_LATSK|nr:acyltransferase [Latilactobacillus sakei]WGI18271.1 acyltransferase [Latilactobacillus sakei]
MFEDQKTKINVSDFQKVSAVTAVMLQTILSFALANCHNQTTAAFVGTLYVFAKYTAPMFIFAIVYNMVKTSEKTSYFEFLKDKFFELVVPYLLWTVAYLLIFPGVQQKTPYTNMGTFLLKVITGDGAPHLWYTVMMLQIQLLMPFFIWLGYRVFANRKLVWPVLIGATVLYIGWYLFYSMQVLNGPLAESWYLLDRFVFSFLIYGIYGVAGFIYHEAIFEQLNRIRFALLPIGLVVGGLSVRALLAYPGDVNFGHAPYLNTLQSLYSLIIILTVFTFASRMIVNQSPKLPLFKWLAVYAYRTYLANVFVFQALLLVFKSTWLRLPMGTMIVVAYLSTATVAFMLSWLLHLGWSGIKKQFS